MSSPPRENARSLEDHASFLRFLSEAAIPFSVIGGCAVGAYAHLQGLDVFSDDLDVYTTPEDLRRVVELVERKGVLIRSLQRPRNVPVAAFDWEGKPVNVLSASVGLPEATRVSATAREFRLKRSPGFSVPLADPYDLFANKMAVNRAKDRPQIAVLRSFIEEEIVAAFRKESLARQRFLPARRYLDVTGDRTLSEGLVARLTLLARLKTDFRFLADQVSTRKQAAAVLRRAPAGLRGELREIVGGRRLRR